MRKIIIDDRKLLQILNEKGKLQKEVDKKIAKFKDLTKTTDEIKAKIEALQNEFKKEYQKVEAEVKRIDEEMKPYLQKMQRYKDKIDPILRKHKIEKGEFEQVQSVDTDNGKVAVFIEDLVEIYKGNLRKQLNG
jgi:oligoendopeptidase F